MNARPASRASYCFDRFTLNLVHGVLRAADGTERPLRPKSFALLHVCRERRPADRSRLDHGGDLAGRVRH